MNPDVEGARVTGTRVRGGEVYDVAIVNPTVGAGGDPYARLLVRLMLDIRSRALGGFEGVALDHENSEKYTIDIGSGTAHLSADSTSVNLLVSNVPFDPGRTRHLPFTNIMTGGTLERTGDVQSELSVHVRVGANYDEVLEESYLASVLEDAGIPGAFFRALFARVEAHPTELRGVFIRLTLAVGYSYEGFRPRYGNGALFELNSEQRSRGWILTSIRTDQWVATLQVNEPMLVVEAIDAPRPEATVREG